MREGLTGGFIDGRMGITIRVTLDNCILFEIEYPDPVNFLPPMDKPIYFPTETIKYDNKRISMLREHFKSSSCYFHPARPEIRSCVYML